MPSHGLLRGACHRARIRATRWLAMTEKWIKPSRRRPGQAKRDPGPITTGLSCWAKVMNSVPQTTDMEYGFLLSQERQRRLCEERLVHRSSTSVGGSDEAIHLRSGDAEPWIASWSLSSGAHSRDPVARNDGEMDQAIPAASRTSEARSG